MLWLIMVIPGGVGVGGLTVRMLTVVVVVVAMGVGGLLLAKLLFISRQQNHVGDAVKNTGPLLVQNLIPPINLLGFLNIWEYNR